MIVVQLVCVLDFLKLNPLLFWTISVCSDCHTLHYDCALKHWSLNNRTNNCILQMQSMHFSFSFTDVCHWGLTRQHWFRQCHGAKQAINHHISQLLALILFLLFIAAVLPVQILEWLNTRKLHGGWTGDSQSSLWYRFIASFPHLLNYREISV